MSCRYFKENLLANAAALLAIHYIESLINSPAVGSAGLCQRTTIHALLLESDRDPSGWYHDHCGGTRFKHVPCMWGILLSHQSIGFPRVAAIAVAKRLIIVSLTDV